MTLKDRITEDMKTAMRARETQRLGTIRLLLAAIKQREVDERISLDDAAVLALVEKLIKQRRDSIEQFSKAARTDLVEQERAELAVLNEYMPAPLSESEVDAAITAALDESGAAGMQDMGRVMALLKPRLAGRADIGAVSARVKAALGAR